MSFGIVAAGVAAAGAIGGAYISSQGAKSAANTQAQAAEDAAHLQNDQYQQTQTNLHPYMQLGSDSISPLLSAMGYQIAGNSNGGFDLVGRDNNNPLMQTFSAPTAEQAQATPGYQFTLQQGLKATQNSAAARGLATSGAALKGASAYSTGLADSTYNDVYNRALSTFNTNYSSAANNVNRLQGLVSSGQNAASTNGSLGAAAANSIGNSITGGANATASGMVGSANALTSGLNGAGNSALLYGLTQNNAGGAPAAPASSTYGNANASSPSGYNVGSNPYNFTA